MEACILWQGGWIPLAIWFYESIRRKISHVRELAATVGKGFVAAATGTVGGLENALGQACGAEENTRDAKLRDDAARLLDTYGNAILRLAYSYLHNTSDAEDILQDTLIQFLRNKPRFESREHEKAWLLRVAANLSKSKIRYNKIRMADELDEQLAAEQREDLSFVWEAVKALPEKYREVVHLFYEEDYSTAQIACVLGRNESTVRSDLRRGRMKLKEILKEAYDFDETVS